MLTRRAATVVWGSMLVVPFFFLAVASTARWGSAPAGTVAFLFWLAVGVSLFNLALSRLLPPRLGPFRAGPEATIFARLLVGWALCEAAAFFPLVAWIVSGDLRLLGIYGVDVLALVLLYPGDQRWESLRPVATPPATPGRERI